MNTDNWIVERNSNSFMMNKRSLYLPLSFHLSSLVRLFSSFEHLSVPLTPNFSFSLSLCIIPSLSWLCANFPLVMLKQNTAERVITCPQSSIEKKRRSLVVRGVPDSHRAKLSPVWCRRWKGGERREKEERGKATRRGRGTLSLFVLSQPIVCYSPLPFSSSNHHRSPFAYRSFVDRFPSNPGLCVRQTGPYANKPIESTYSNSRYFLPPFIHRILHTKREKAQSISKRD